MHGAGERENGREREREREGEKAVVVAEQWQIELHQTQATAIY